MLTSKKDEDFLLAKHVILAFQPYLFKIAVGIQGCKTSFKFSYNSSQTLLT